MNEDKQVKYQILAFMGKSGSGKDFTANYLWNKAPYKFHKVVSCTTRPPRDNEVDGKDYHFIDTGSFAEHVLDGSMLEATCYNNNWYYGTCADYLNPNKINVAVLNPEGIRRLAENENVELKVYYVDGFNDKKRLIKILTREVIPDCHEVCRRFLADEEMFDDIDDIDFTALWNSYDEEYTDNLQLLFVKRSFEDF